MIDWPRYRAVMKDFYDNQRGAEMNYKDGDEITVNGKDYRIEGGALVPVVNRGPLGGVVKRGYK